MELEKVRGNNSVVFDEYDDCEQGNIPLAKERKAMLALQLEASDGAA